MKIFFVLGLMFGYAALTIAQVNNKFQTSASCSPIITGGNSPITINCPGVSPAKARQLTDLMNRILAEKLDISAVNSKLDQLDSEIKGVHKDLSDLMAVGDPMSLATPALRERLNEGNLLSARCSTYSRDWTDAMQEFSRPPITPDKSAWMARYGETNVRFSTQYKTELQEKLLEWRQLVFAEHPELVSSKDYTVVRSSKDLSGVCLDFTLMGLHYRNLIVQNLEESHRR